MKNKEIKSNLEMLDLYFSKFDFTQNKENITGSMNLKTEFKINYAKNNEDESLNRIQIITTIKDENNKFNLLLETTGLFKLDITNLDTAFAKNIIHVNTVTIMFPFIRSQIALLTTQPGMSPIMLDIIDVDKLVNGDRD